MIDFEPTEDQLLARDAVSQFAKSMLAPQVREFERARAVPEAVRRVAAEMGLALPALPESVGGQGLGLVTTMLLEEELGAADPAAAFGLAGPHGFGFAVSELGTEDQAREALLDFTSGEAHDRFGGVAWSEQRPHADRPGFTTTATRAGDSWTVSGEKWFVSNAQLADRWVVFAQTSPLDGWRGIGAFIVNKDDPGVSVGPRHDTLGLDCADFGVLELASVKLPEARRLLGGDDFTAATLRYFAKHALVIAARSVGLSRFAWELAREHCDNRTAFGKPIGHFQAVAFTLSDRLMDVESARWLLWKAAHAWDASDSAKSEKRALHATAQAVAHALEACMRCGDDCVGLHGGSGFIRDLVAEKLMRDAKQLALCCPTAEQLDQLAAAIDLGVELDPALVLPTPDTQAIFT